MMYWNGDWNWGAWLAMALTMVAFWGLLAWAVVSLVKSSSRRDSRNDAESILAERLARGELTPAEYDELRRVLRK
jgi:putative membrane protein